MSDVDILKHKQSISIESLVTSVQWSGHIRMKDNRILKQFLYWELTKRKRSVNKLKLRYKLYQEHTAGSQHCNWENLTLNHSSQGKAVHSVKKDFEPNDVEHEKLECDAHKGLDINFPENVDIEFHITSHECNHVTEQA